MRKLALSALPLLFLTVSTAVIAQTPKPGPDVKKLEAWVGTWHYEGDAKAWQGANRVSGDVLDIDQIRHVMLAHGKVETQFYDKVTKPGPAPVTTVRAPDLEYSTETRIAYYKGGVHLERPGLTVDSKELRAFLKGDAGALTAAIRRALDDPALRRRMADAAWAAGQALPRWEDTARRIAHVIEGLGE